MHDDDERLRELMQRAHIGDEAAYREVLEGTRVFLERYLATRVAPAAVDDIVQETLISIHAKRATFDPDRSFLAWASAIARYRMIDHLRSGSRHMKLAEHVAHQPDLDVAVRPADDAVLAGLTVGNLLHRLPDGQANAIRVVKLEGRSTKEAATLLAISESLVKVRVFRGMRQLVTMIERDEL